jgi:hypothetical protein
MISRIPIIILLASTIGLHAEPRLWSSPNGQRSISGEFLKRDATTVTIRYADGKVVTNPLAHLHPKDLNWVNMMHPMPNPAVPNQTVPNKTVPNKAVLDKSVTDKTVPNKAAVFDQLVFGDTRERVFTKLKASKFVALTVDETFLGRTGLNGVFRTRKKIGGLDASLFFDWTDGGELKVVTLQTETVPDSAYQTLIGSSWKAFINLLTTLYDKPVQQSSLPRTENLADGSFSPSHLWALETGGSVLLGTARDGDKYQLVVRFTQNKINPLGLP